MRYTYSQYFNSIGRMEYIEYELKYKYATEEK